MADFVAVPIDEDEPSLPTSDQVRPVALFEATESDLVALQSGAADIQPLTDSALGSLQSIAGAAEQVYRSIKERVGPDKVELEISVGLSGEVGWFVAKSSTTGGVKLTLTWEREEDPSADSASESPES